MTYSLLLQTVSTICTVVGVSCAVYAALFAHRVHDTVRDIHETVKAQQARDRGAA